MPDGPIEGQPARSRDQAQRRISQQKFRFGPAAACRWTEPNPTRQGRTDMRSTTLLICAAVLAATACGTDKSDNADDTGQQPKPEPSGSGPTDSLVGQPVDAELVLLADSVDAAVAPPTMLADPTAVQAYPGWFSAEPDLYGEVRDALTGLPDYPNASSPLLAFTNGPSCAAVDDAKLMADGSQVYAVFEGQKHEECLAPHTQVAIFAVDRGQLPKSFDLVGTDSADAASDVGPGELVAFQELDATARSAPPFGLELVDQGALNNFVAGLPSHQAEVRREVGKLDPTARTFGFVLTGCAATTAELVVTPSHVTAATVGGEAVRCIRPVHYAAVFTVDADHLPADVTVR
jgi:hypothetical protein